MRSIQIDDEVYAYLRSRVEDFGETENDVLRRQLLRPAKRPGRKRAHAATNGAGAASPASVMLSHVFEVIRLVALESRTRKQATREVAERHDIAWQTVQDQYARVLSQGAAEFDALLALDRRSDLEALLRERFPEESAAIDQFFAELDTRTG